MTIREIVFSEENLDALDQMKAKADAGPRIDRAKEIFDQAHGGADEINR